MNQKSASGPPMYALGSVTHILHRDLEMDVLKDQVLEALPEFIDIGKMGYSNQRTDSKPMKINRYSDHNDRLAQIEGKKA